LYFHPVQRKDLVLPTESPNNVSLTSQWFIRPGCEDQVIEAVTQLAAEVESQEPGTLTYLVHTQWAGDGGLQSLPPFNPLSLLFFEIYRDAQAFQDHVNGPLFTQFVQLYGDHFVTSGGKSIAEGARPYTTVQFLSRRAGYVRDLRPRSMSVGESEPSSANQHPAVMFEVIANNQAAAQSFYSQVFGWTYQTGTDGFAYVHFPDVTRPLLGGIGQADSSVPGFEPGHSFYILVDNVEAAIARALEAGGAEYMAPASVDGYRFAMIRDPEGNPVGLIEPFSE
jgi:predicted enzyme related to lactoylglutathione lyase/quinol monooxygenase YgiN